MLPPPNGEISARLAEGMRKRKRVFEVTLKTGVRMFFWRKIVIFANVYNVVSYGSNR